MVAALRRARKEDYERAKRVASGVFSDRWIDEKLQSAANHLPPHAASMMEMLRR